MSIFFSSTGLSNLLHTLFILPFFLSIAAYDVVTHPARSALTPSGLPVATVQAPWRQGAPLPSWRYEFGAAHLNDHIYIVGGLTLPTVYTVTNKMEIYDVRSDTWEDGLSLPVIVHHPGFASDGKHLYLAGGHGLRITPYAHLFVYDPGTHAWTQKKDMPTARGALGVAAIDGAVYAVGGTENGHVRGELERYDPATDSWSPRAPMPTAREHLAVVAVGGKLFALGGFTTTRFESLTTNEVYDPVTDTWEKRAPLPLPLSGFAAAASGDSIFIFGGQQGWPVSGEVHEYLVREDRWIRRTDLPRARYGLVAVTTDNGIHLLGGNTRVGGPDVVLDHDIFSPGQ